MENNQIYKFKMSSAEIDDEVEEEEEHFKNLQIEKILSRNFDEHNEVNLDQFYIDDSETHLHSLTKINFSSILNTNLQEKNLEIIPNKMKTVKNFMFFTYCQISNKNKYREIMDFNFLIQEDIFSNPDTLEKSSSSRILLNSSSLEIKLDQLNNFVKHASFNFFSNFFVIPLQNSFIIFLIVYKYVLIIRIKFDKKNDKTEINYEILFKKEYTESNFLLYIGSENLSKIFKFYVLFKPGNRLLTFHCNFLKENFNEINIEENNIETSLENFLRTKMNSNQENFSFSLSKITVTKNSDEILFYDKSTNNIYLVNKTNFNSVKALRDSTGEIKNHKNFFTLPFETQSKATFLVTDEICDNSVKISLWKIRTEEADVDAGIANCEKLQSVFIHTVNMACKLGGYNFTLIDENYFSLYFQDYDVIFIFNVCMQTNSNDPAAFIENIYEFSFQELFAYMFDYQINQEGILSIILYQEEEFLRYTLDLNNFERKRVKKITVEELRLESEGEMCEDPPQSILKILTSVVHKREKCEIKKSEFIKNEIANKLNSSSNTSGNDSRREINLKNINESLVENEALKSDKSDKSLCIDILPLNTESNLKENYNIIQLEQKTNENTLHVTKPTNLIPKFPESITNDLVKTIEDKLDKILNNKLNSFSDKISNQLSNVYSLMKTQTEELQQTRKKNEETMNKLMEIITQSKKNSPTPTTNTNQSFGQKNINDSNPNINLAIGPNKASQLNSMIIPNKSSQYMRAINNSNNSNNNNNRTNTNIHPCFINSNSNNNQQSILPQNFNLNNQNINLQHGMQINPMLAMQQRLYSNIYQASINSSNNIPTNIINESLGHGSSTRPLVDLNLKQNLPNNINNFDNTPQANTKSMPLNQNIINPGLLATSVLPNKNTQYFNNIYANNTCNTGNIGNTSNTGNTPITNANYSYLYNQGYGFVHPYYLTNINSHNNKINEIITDCNKFKEDDIALANFEQKLSEIKREEVDYKIQFDLNKEENKLVNYSSDISSGNIESDCIALKEIKCRNETDALNSVDELDMNSVSALDQNLIYKSEMDLLNSFFSNPNGDEYLQSGKPKEKKHSMKKNIFSEKLSAISLKDKLYNSNPKKNKKKKNK